MTTLEKRILELSWKYKLSHLGSCLSAVPIIDTIYKIKDREENFILSAGHSGLSLYVVIEKYDIIADAEMALQKMGVHPDRLTDPWGKIDCSTGSLGMGIGVAVGMAIGNRKRNVYCLISDGETAEGSLWEALRIASEQKLNNLKVILNFNGYSAYGEVELEPLIARFQAFGWGILKIDKEVDLESALEAQIKDVPIIRIVEANLIEFPFLQGQDSHYKILSEEEYLKYAKT